MRYICHGLQGIQEGTAHDLRHYALTLVWEGIALVWSENKTLICMSGFHTARELEGGVHWDSLLPNPPESWLSWTLCKSSHPLSNYEWSQLLILTLFWGLDHLIIPRWLSWLLAVRHWNMILMKAGLERSLPTLQCTEGVDLIDIAKTCSCS